MSEDRFATTVDLVTVDEIASLLGKHRSTIYRVLQEPDAQRRRLTDEAGTKLIRRDAFLQYWSERSASGEGLAQRQIGNIALLRSLQEDLSSAAQVVSSLANDAAARTEIGLLAVFKDRIEKGCMEQMESAVAEAKHICLAGVSLRDFFRSDSRMFRILMKRIQQGDDLTVHGVVLRPDSQAAQLRSLIESSGSAPDTSARRPRGASSSPPPFRERRFYRDFLDTFSGYMALRRTVREVGGSHHQDVRVRAISYPYPFFLLAASFGRGAGSGYLLVQDYLLAPVVPEPDSCIGFLLPVFKYSEGSAVFHYHRQMFEYFGEFSSGASSRTSSLIADGVWLEEWSEKRLDSVVKEFDGRLASATDPPKGTERKRDYAGAAVFGH